MFVHSFGWRQGRLTTGEADEQPPKRIGLGSFLARILGWTIFGALMGVAQGLARESTQVLRNAALGGAIGGGLGAVGFLIVAGVAAAVGLGDMLARLLGMMILAACIGLCMVVVERALSAVLAIRSGKYEGREIFLDKPLLRIGRNDSFEVFLGGDPQVVAHHANIRQDGNSFRIESVDATVSVNGTPTQRRSTGRWGHRATGQHAHGVQEPTVASTDRGGIPAASRSGQAAGQSAGRAAEIAAATPTTAATTSTATNVSTRAPLCHDPSEEHPDVRARKTTSWPNSWDGLPSPSRKAGRIWKSVLQEDVQVLPS